MQHQLKTCPEYFLQIVCGHKTFEIRKNDRNFKLYDTLKLIEFDPVTGEYTHQSVTVKVSYIMDLSLFGLPDHVAMAITVTHYNLHTP